MSPPLQSVRVLDLSRILAGPWCTQILSDLGAEVIKVERPGSGDDTRGWGPPYLKDADGNETDVAAYYLSCNRGKRSITVDMATSEGQDLVRRLAAQSDVVIENYKAGGLARYGLDYASLEALNPRLVYCSITGFGQTGPYAGRAGYDFLIQAMGGLMSVTGHADGEPGGGPLRVGVAMADIMTGMYATVAILAALNERERSGLGQHIDMALLDTQTAVLANQATNYFTSGTAPGRQGNSHPNVVPYQVFETSDGHLIIAVGNDAQFARLCATLGAPELADDDRYRANTDRIRNRDALISEIRGLVRGWTKGDLISALEQVGVPAGPINTIDEVFADPQVQHRGLRMTLPHPRAGTVDLVGSPIRYSRTPVAYQGAPPDLNADAAWVLRERLRLDDAEIAALQAAGAVNVAESGS
jgi:crotonobetainyl-CoA:carnitine CoA-transferase CaiB-like acyl-CoA transferase